MSAYPTYSRPPKFVDIPANPGFKVRMVARYGPGPVSSWLDVVAWRINQDEGAPLGSPIVVRSSGLEILGPPNPYREEQYEFVFPGEQIPEDQR